MERKLEQLVMFIEREAAEKEIELNASADDEYHDYVYQLVNQEKKKINEQYDKKEKAVLKANVLTKAVVKNKSRLETSLLKHKMVEDVFNQVNSRIKKNVGSKNYRDVLKKLALQCMMKLLAPKVLARVRQSDYDLLAGMVPEIKQHYEKTSRIPIKVRVDGKYFLPDYEIGGVVMYATTGEKKVVNTLRFRLNLIYEKMLPVVRHYLMGPNPARKYYN